MGRAFVAKLAREGARDPEALAAWIGRKKHGKKAFQKLAAKNRKQKTEPASDVTGKAMSREERRQVNSMAADLWNEKGFQRANASTPQEGDAKTREDVLKRRAIEKARRRGVVRGDLPEWEAAQAREQARRGRLERPVNGELVRPETPESRQRFTEVRDWARDTLREEEQRERSERVKPSTAQEQADIDRAAAGLVDRPDMLRQLDARLPAEGAAMTRQQVIQRRAVEKAKKLLAAQRR